MFCIILLVHLIFANDIAKKKKNYIPLITVKFMQQFFLEISTLVHVNVI